MYILDQSISSIQQMFIQEFIYFQKNACKIDCFFLPPKPKCIMSNAQLLEYFATCKKYIIFYGDCCLESLTLYYTTITWFMIILIVYYVLNNFFTSR